MGTEEKPFMKEAKITVHGTILDPEIPIYGAKVFLIILMLHHFLLLIFVVSAAIARMEQRYCIG